VRDTESGIEFAEAPQHVGILFVDCVSFFEAKKLDEKYAWGP
jgi:hypothetical protein